MGPSKRGNGADWASRFSQDSVGCAELAKRTASYLPLFTRFQIPNFLRLTISPISGVNPLFDTLVESGIRPIGAPRHMSMLHWIEMDVIEMVLKIRFVANNVLPETTLPDFSLPALHPAGREIDSDFWQGTRKSGFE